MVARRVESANSIIPPECQDRERSIRLVALLFCHTRTPKIIFKKIFQWHMGSQIFIVSYGCHVVKHKSAFQSIPVKQKTKEEQKGLE